MELFSSTQEGVCARKKKGNAASLQVQCSFPEVPPSLLSYKELGNLFQSRAKCLIWLFHSDLLSR